MDYLAATYETRY